MTGLDRRTFLQATGAALVLAGVGAATGGAVARADTVPPGAVADLRRRLRGTVLVPGDAGYDTAGQPANGRYRHIRPAVIARCADEADVVTCVRWSTENGVHPVSRGGGHSYAGLSTTESLLVDISALRSFTVDAAAGTAVCGGSALNQDLIDATIDTPLFLPGGTCLGVGLGGLVLGGGIGYNMHWAGLTADHLLSSRIVTAAGEVLEIDADRHPDLFWACRGGAGGSFGINTSFTFDLVDVPADDITYFRFDWRGADAAEAALAAYDALAVTAPPAFNSSFMAQAAPVGAGGPREAIDLFARGQYVGPPGELEELVRPLLEAAGPPVTSVVEPMSFWDVQRIWVTSEPPQHNFGDISRYAREPVPDAVVAQLIDLLTRCPVRTETDNGSMWSLGWVGGDVVNAVGRTDTAYVHRGMSTLLRPTPVWDENAPAGVGEDLLAWTDDMAAVIAPHTPDESYQNFPNRRIENWPQQYYAENWDRLVDVKTRYDRHDLFRNPQSIPPRERHGTGHGDDGHHGDDGDHGDRRSAPRG
ncbi:MAG TPA: FAD-binding oxidoreductase [Geodermatophilus sp.]|nr:FAD-binding oxidoreductase [Geodermatophilus sp.]